MERSKFYFSFIGGFNGYCYNQCFFELYPDMYNPAEV